MKISVYCGTSLDGFIAREDGDIEWLNEANATVPPGEDCGYADFMSSVDVLVMGRKTYEQVLEFGAWPYGNTRVIVLSSRSIAFPDTVPNTVAHSSETPRALCDRLSVEGVKHVYVDGGTTIQRFFAEGLVDEITVTIIPILLGTGISLFGPLEQDLRLTLLDAKSFDFGFVQMTYSVDSK